MAAFESFTLFWMPMMDYQNATAKAIDLRAMQTSEMGTEMVLGYEKMEYRSIGVMEKKAMKTHFLSLYRSIIFIRGEEACM